MLVLTRKKGEKLMVGDNIVITVVDVEGDRVRIGVDAPRDVSVHRKEVYDAIVEENRLAMKAPFELAGLSDIIEKAGSAKKGF